MGYKPPWAPQLAVNVPPGGRDRHQSHQEALGRGGDTSAAAFPPADLPFGDKYGKIQPCKALSAKNPTDGAPFPDAAPQNPCAATPPVLLTHRASGREGAPSPKILKVHPKASSSLTSLSLRCSREPARSARLSNKNIQGWRSSRKGKPRQG